MHNTVYIAESKAKVRSFVKKRALAKVGSQLRYDLLSISPIIIYN